MYQFNTDSYSGFGEGGGGFSNAVLASIFTVDPMCGLAFFGFLFEIMGRARWSRVFITWDMCSITKGFLISYPKLWLSGQSDIRSKEFLFYILQQIVLIRSTFWWRLCVTSAC